MCSGTNNVSREKLKLNSDKLSIVSDDDACEEKKKYSVRFAPRVLVRKTLSRHDYSESERREYWFEQKDYENFKRMNSYIGSNINDLSKVSPNAPRVWLHKIDHSSRGIEHLFCNPSPNIKRATRLSVIKNVLEFQRHQRRTQKMCPEKLARTSMKYTAASRRRSFDLGKFDEQSMKKTERDDLMDFKFIKCIEQSSENIRFGKENIRQ